MGLINNGEVVNAYTNDLNLQPTVSKVLNSNSDFVQPTYDFSNTRLINVVAFGNSANTTTTTIYTTPSDRDFFLTSANFAWAKDATATSQNFSLRSTVYGGGVTQILQGAGITLVAMNGQQGINFNPPLRLARGAAVTLNSSNAVANTNMNGTIMGFTKGSN